MLRNPRSLHLLCSAIATVGCSDFRLDPIDAHGAAPLAVAVTEEFVQVPLPAVDLLFIMDDTASMAQEQASLASQFSALPGALDGAAVRWQIGVVGMSASPLGWLVGAPYLVTPDTADAGSALVERATVGTVGPGPETGFSTALAALDLAAPGGPNEGFLREDAILHLIFVSDGDDASAGLGEEPVTAFFAALEAWTVSGHAPTVSAITGDLPGGCSSSAGVALPGAAFALAVGLTGGTLASICAADLGPFIASVADRVVVLDQRFALLEAPMEGRPVVVEVDGVRADGWTLDLENPAIDFESPPPAGSIVRVSYLVELR